MRLHLDRDRDEPLLWDETIEHDPVALGHDLLLAVGPIAVRGRVDRVERELSEARAGAAARRGPAAHSAGPASFHVGMDLRYRQTLACTRCLEPVHSEVATRTDLDVVTHPIDRRSGPTPEIEVELEKDDLGVVNLTGEHLQTEPLVAEQVLLEVPMKPLCTPECRGLCPRCGANRNVTPSCCEEPVFDERWEALGALRDRLSSENR